MTLITVGWNVGDGGYLSDLMPEGSVTTRTFNLMISDMFLVHELRGIFGCQQNGFIMTFETLSFRDMTISLNDAEMALLTGNPPCNILFVIETPTLNFDITFGLDMTGGTSSDGT
jgi:hypothetical protein